MTSASDWGHIQRRLEKTYGLFASLLGGMMVLGLAAEALLAAPEIKIPRLALAGMVGAVLLPLVASWLARGPARGGAAVATIDGVTLLGLMTCVSLAARHLPASMRGDQLATTVFTLVVTLRAALLPSPPWWTALVSAGGALPAAVAPILVAAREFPVRGRDALRSFGQLGAVGWCLAATIAAWAISRLVYGIRKQLASAEQLGQYTLEEKIGEGGMGTVYRARHALLRRPTAIKLMLSYALDDANSRRFEREVQLTSALTHPNTIVIYDYGRTSDGVFYYAMELLDGVTLSGLSKREGPQPIGRVIHILRQVAEALAEAHAAGLIHRDVKPANIFLCTRGGIHDFVKLLDFGIVKELHVEDPGISGDGGFAGTPLFMAPESLTRPDRVDARADIYALGAVGYTLLTGVPPFPGSNAVDIYHGHLYGRPRPVADVLGVATSEDLELLLLECLAKEPADRPASSRALAASLARLQVAHPWTEADAEAAWRSLARPAPPSESLADPTPAPTVALGRARRLRVDRDPVDRAFFAASPRCPSRAP